VNRAFRVRLREKSIERGIGILLKGPVWATALKEFSDWSPFCKRACAQGPHPPLSPGPNGYAGPFLKGSGLRSQGDLGKKDARTFMGSKKTVTLNLLGFTRLKSGKGAHPAVPWAHQRIKSTDGSAQEKRNIGHW